MKKYLKVLLILGIVFTLATGCSSGSTDTTGESGESEDKVITMKLANANPSGDIKEKVSLKFAELVDAKTDGKVKIEVYSGGSLGDWRDTIEGLGMGVNEIVIEGLSALDAYTNIANVDALPYIYDNAEHWKNVMTGEVGKELTEAIGEEGGFKVLAPQYRGARVTTTNVPFTNVDEVNGLKIRVPNTQSNIRTWTWFGAAPTPLALTETFTAIQQSTVVAQENPLVESYGHGFYDVCDYLVLTNHVYGSDVFIFDSEYFSDLDPQIQTAIEEAAYEAGAWRTEEVLKMEGEYIKKFEEAGVTVIEPELESFMSSLDGFVAEEYPDLVEWVEKIQNVK